VSLVAVIISAGFDLTASISTRGDGEAVSPGLADIGAPSSAGTGPDGGGIECTGVTAANVADAAALCAGPQNGRTYQHLR